MTDAPAQDAPPVTPSASVHSWDISVGVDGPGTRFVVFLAGCPLRCLYCHNPDTWQRRRGQVRTLDEVLTDIARHERFLRIARGGVTASGGEPLLQPAFVQELFAACRARGLHTALDTSGFLGARASDSLLDNTSLVLLDIKSSDPATYRTVTGVPLTPTLTFARRLAERGNPTWVRFVLVPGLTDAVDNVAGVARICAELGNVERVDVLPFHSLGKTKYDELGLRFPLEGIPAPGDALLARVRDQFADAGLTVA